MTAQLQALLRDTILGCTGIPEKYIYLELRDENEYQLVPHASILPDAASLETAPAFEQSYAALGGITRVYRKYWVSQPWEVYIRRATTEECTGDAEAFLVALPLKALCEDGAWKTLVSIEPQNMEFLLAKGRMDICEARIGLTMRYGIYRASEAGLIKDIKIEAKIDGPHNGAQGEDKNVE